MLMTNTQVEELLDKLSELSGLDDRLSERCDDLIRTEQYDAAVTQAFVLLEERLRDALGKDKGAGVNLSELAFAPKTGQLGQRLDLSEGEVAGVQSLFVGAFKAFRNPAAHSKVGHDRDEARAIIHLVNLLLMILEQTRRPVGPYIPEDMAKALGRDATARLRDFLVRLQTLRIGQSRGKDLWPLRGTLLYKYPGWAQAKPHPIAILYLHAKRPELWLSGGTLMHVAGLDLADLELQFVRAGCERTTNSMTPIRLKLADHNDQVTFDRIYGILEDLVKNYGA